MNMVIDTATIKECHKHMIGAVICIAALLKIAGVESNPGPSVDLGTMVLRKAFDDIVGTDFMAYISRTCQAKKFKFIKNKVLNEEQKLKLPKSINFDISLLVCLLKNVCGLKPYDDAEWENDKGTSFESYVGQLKKLRNKDSHVVSMYSGDVAALWLELCRILEGLNVTVNIPDLQDKIDNVETMIIDKKLQDLHLQTLKQWQEMDELCDKNIGKSIESTRANTEELNTTEVKLRGINEQLEKLVNDGTFQKPASGSGHHIGGAIQRNESSEICTDTDSLIWIEASKTDILAATITKLFECRDKLINRDALTEHDLSYLVKNLGTLNSQILDPDEKIEIAKQRTPDYQIDKFHHGAKELIKEVNKSALSVQRIQDIVNDLMDIVALLMKKFDKEHPYSYNEQRGSKRRSNNDDDTCNSPKHQMVKHPNIDFEKGIIENLLTRYRNNQLETFPNEYYGIVEVFKWPYMFWDGEPTGKEIISSIEDLLCRGDLFLMGETCKSSLMKYLTWQWCKTKEQKCSTDIDLTTIGTFDFIFHISPPMKVPPIDVIDVIIQSLFYTEISERFRNLHFQLKDILTKKKCLLIFDGFNPADLSSSDQQIKSDSCTYITVCNNDTAKDELLKDKHVVATIKGLDGNSLTGYLEYLLRLLSVSNQKLTVDEFIIEVDECGLKDKLGLPAVASRLLLLWSQGGFKKQTKEQILKTIKDK